jgi:thiazolinyl imide reductase
VTRCRVLVCGSHYGAAYVRAIRQRPDAWELAGVLARGSERSRRLAERARTALYTSTADLPHGIDLACAAMGSAAFDVVLELIRRGIHVLLEHPVAPNQLEQALNEAAAHAVCCHVQTLFPSMPAARAFAAESHARASRGDPRFIDVLSTDRSLYATLDIVRRAVGPLDATGFHAIQGRPFEMLQGKFGSVPAFVRVQRSVADDGHRLADGAAEYLVDCRVGVWFENGALTLLSVAGPVVWTAAFRPAGEPGDPCWRTDQPPATRGDLLRQQTASNLEALEALRTHAAGRTAPASQTREHLLDVSRAWERLAVTTGL